MKRSETPAIERPEPTWNTTELLARRVAATPDRPLFAVPDNGGWKDITAGQFNEEVRALAKGFIAQGLEPGERVAFIAQTSYQWTLVDFALWTAGLVMVPVYETSSAAQLEWMMQDSGAVAIITELPTHTATADSIADAVPQLRFRAELHNDAIASLMQQGESIADEEVERRRTLAKGDDMATLIYTSGSTGRPKGVVLTHANFVDLSRNTAHTLEDLIKGDSSTLLFITLAHVFARLISVLCVHGGVKVGHQPNTAKLVESLASFKPTFLLAVPRVFEKVYNAAEQKADAAGTGNLFRRAARVGIAYSRSLDKGKTPFGLKLQYTFYNKLVFSKIRDAMGGRVVHAVSGSAPLGNHLGHFYRAIGVIILEGYGLTETTAPISVNVPSHSKVGTVGPPLPGCSVAVDSDGEILAKGVNIFREYWNNPEATRNAFTEDGWFRTGDLGQLDDDGYLTVTGRKKELIVTAGGKNVSPATLEDPINSDPIIGHCVVVGDKKPFIAAMMTLDPAMLTNWLENQGEDPTMSLAEAAQNPRVLAHIQHTIDRANTRVSRAESIRKFVVLDQEFSEDDGTLTPKLSIRRHVILEKYAGVIDGIYNVAPPTRGISLK
ncbi:AMP-dependent synthetase/ligase [Pseudoclavibacter albus]|uniref:AMP-dependent synthetase/ligase n=1 Tax=Pseudoclavibacter albus TaxID=272241 RepID=UPI000824EB9D|nr:long-chain fatty acid--CoA ligase [Pseudoclavibacter alba]